MKSGVRVRLTKEMGVIAPLSKSDRVNPNIGYTLDGILLNDVEIGQAIKVWRDHRNGEAVLGLFTSSPVKQIAGDKMHTQNSIWKLEVL